MHGENSSCENGVLAYAISSTAANTPLIEIPSTYQETEEGALAHSGEIYWSPNSCFVAMDEENIRFRGNLFIVALAEGNAHRVELPNFLGQTGDQWERYRIRVHKGWITPDCLSLLLGGQVTTATPGVYETISYEIVLRLTASGKGSVVSISPKKAL